MQVPGADASRSEDLWTMLYHTALVAQPLLIRPSHGVAVLSGEPVTSSVDERWLSEGRPIEFTITLSGDTFVSDIGEEDFGLGGTSALLSGIRSLQSSITGFNAVIAPRLNAMNLQRLKPLEIQEGDVQLVAGRVTVQNGIQVIADGTPDAAVILQRFQNHLPEHHCRGCWTVEQIRQMKAQRTLKLLVIEDSRVEKARQNGLCRSSLAGFVTNALPNGVTVLHLFDAVALSGCHRVLLRRPKGFNGREAKGSPVIPASLVGEFPTESPQRLASPLVFTLKQGHRRGGTDGIDIAF